MAHRLRLQVLRADQVEERPARVSVGEDDGGADGLAAGQLDADGCRLRVALDQDTSHGCAGANRRPALVGRRGQRLGQPAHAANYETLLQQPAKILVEEAEVGSCAARAEGCADDGRAAQRALQRVALEPLVQVVAGGHRQDAHQFHHVVAAQPFQAQGQRRPAHQVAATQGAQIGRGQQQHTAQQPGHACHLPPKGRPAFCVAGAEAGDLLHRARFVAPEGQGAAVGLRGAEQRRAGLELQPVASQVELADDLVLEEGRVGRAAVHAIARPRLFRARRAAQRVAPFQHQHAPPGRGQCRRGHQSIMPRADDNCVVVVVHVRFLFMGGERVQGDPPCSSAPPLPYASSLPNPERFQRPQPPRRAHDAAAGVGAGAALEVALDWGAVLRIASSRA